MCVSVCEEGEQISDCSRANCAYIILIMRHAHRGRHMQSHTHLHAEPGSLEIPAHGQPCIHTNANQFSQAHSVQLQKGHMSKYVCR